SQTPPPAEAGEPSAGTLTGGSRKTDEVVLFADSWSNHFAPRILAAAVAVLEHAGVSVRVIDQTVCCGLPLISTGQLDVARANLSETITARRRRSAHRRWRCADRRRRALLHRH